MDRICIFARVSTSIQEYDRQVNELTTLAQRNGWNVEAIFCEKVSGAKKNAERKELSRMVDYDSHRDKCLGITQMSLTAMGNWLFTYMEYISMESISCIYPHQWTMAISY